MPMDMEGDLAVLGAWVFAAAGGEAEAPAATGMRSLRRVRAGSTAAITRG